VEAKRDILITVGNIYLDHNILGVEGGGKPSLESGRDYFADHTEVVVGGSAVNFAMQATNLGMEVAFLGRVGKDPDGNEAKKLLEQKGVISDLIITSEGAITSTAYNLIFSKSGEFVGVHLGNASANLSPEQIDLNNPLFNRAQAVYFGGTVKQKRIFESFPTLFESLNKKSIKIIADPNRFPIEEQSVQREVLLDSLKYIDCYLPNEDEIKQLTDKGSLDEALDITISKGAKLVVVKMGAQGCRIRTKDRDQIIEGFRVNSITTVGAGDAFNAGFITQYLRGFSLEESAKFANAVAAFKVKKNINPSHQEVEDFLRSF
jgi:sugar/nucleoside kinase (ribokinase family)